MHLNATPGNSYFISIENSTVWQRKGFHSMFNPEYICCIVHLVRMLLATGLPQDKMLILSYYSEERRILSEILNGSYGYKNVEISSVDSAQGKEKDVVIVSTCRPGGKIGLGFVADRQRQCVAMSRARDGLIIVGNKRMGDGGQSSGQQCWKDVVNYFAGQRRLVSVPGNRTAIQERLNIPNPQIFSEVHGR